jgi:hypothetical protein
MLTHITHIEPHLDFSIDITFSDGLVKNISFQPFIERDHMGAPLKDFGYFNQVKVYDSGRGIYWPNEYDFCPDYLHDLVA